jgi:hypothetical protein
MHARVKVPDLGLLFNSLTARERHTPAFHTPPNIALLATHQNAAPRQLGIVTMLFHESIGSAQMSRSSMRSV